MTEAIQQQQQQHAIDSYGFGEKKGWVFSLLTLLLENSFCLNEHVITPEIGPQL